MKPYPPAGVEPGEETYVKEVDAAGFTGFPSSLILFFSPSLLLLGKEGSHTARCYQLKELQFLKPVRENRMKNCWGLHLFMVPNSWVFFMLKIRVRNIAILFNPGGVFFGKCVFPSHFLHHMFLHQERNVRVLKTLVCSKAEKIPFTSNRNFDWLWSGLEVSTACF